MVIDLQVVVDLRMIMALRALHVLAKKDSPHIARQSMGVAPSLEEESLLGSCGLVPPNALDDPLHEHIDRSVRVDGISKISDPGGSIDILIRTALQKGLIVPIDHPFAVSRIGKKSVDPPLPAALGRLG